MVTRTFGINGGSRKPAGVLDAEYKGGSDYFDGPLGPQLVNNEPLDLGTPYDSSYSKGQTNTPALAMNNDQRQFVMPAAVQSPTDPMETSSSAYGLKEYAADRQKDKEQVNSIKLGAAILQATGGIINAQSKYSQIAAQNTYNIQQADSQIMQVASSAAFQKLREDVKGKERGNDALISAVGQGQSANGDLAKTAVTSEEIFAAQNMMAIEINSMRQAFGIESKIRQLKSNTEIAKINRTGEMSQAVLSAVSSYAGSVQ